MRPLFIALLALIAIAGSVRAATLLVPSEYPTIQSGIDAAAFGDTVLVDCGSYLEAGLVLGKEIVLRGNSSDPTCVVLDGQDANRLLVVQTSVAIEQLTLSRGVAPNTRGGAVRVISGEARFRNCRITESRGNVGGGVAVELGAAASFEDCLFRNNGGLTEAGSGGAVHVASLGVVRFLRCDFESNSVQRFGGAIALSRALGTEEMTLRLEGCSFRNNSARYGGAIALTGAGMVAEVTSTSFHGNEAEEFGGDVHAAGPDAFLFLQNSSVSGSRSGDDGGSIWLGGFVTLHGTTCDFSGAESPNWGGVLELTPDAKALLVDCIFSDNRSGLGGAVHAYRSRLDVLGCRFEGNMARLGGAMHVVVPKEGGDRIENCEFIANEASSLGGALSLEYGASAPGTCEGSLFLQNVAADRGGAGRSYNSTYRRCTFVGNECEGEGSALWLTSTSSIENCILTGSLGSAPVFCQPGNEPNSVTCTDIWGNESGDWTGCLAQLAGQDGNLSADPRFCDPEQGHFDLQSNSPCAPDGSAICGQIGAYGVGCGTVSVTPTTFSRIKAAYRDGGQP